jgi:hypothetical protein
MPRSRQPRSSAPCASCNQHVRATHVHAHLARAQRNTIMSHYRTDTRAAAMAHQQQQQQQQGEASAGSSHSALPFGARLVGAAAGGRGGCAEHGAVAVWSA